MNGRILYVFFDACRMSAYGPRRVRSSVPSRPPGAHRVSGFELGEIAGLLDAVAAKAN
jgi:hypothetical protein